MIPWPTLQPGLVTLVGQLTGLTQVFWQDTQTAPGTFVAASQVAKAELMAFAMTSSGKLDALTWAEQSPNGPLLQTAKGVREFTLRTKVTVYDQLSNLVARNYLEQMRDRMAWDSTRDTLMALSLGFQSALSLTDLSKPVDGHIASIAALDVRFNLGTSDTDPTQYSRISTGTFAPTYSH